MRFRHIILMLALALATPSARAAEGFSCEYLFGKIEPVLGNEPGVGDSLWQDDRFLISTSEREGQPGLIHLRELSSGIEKRFEVPGEARGVHRAGDHIFFFNQTGKELQAGSLNINTGRVKLAGPKLEHPNLAFQPRASFQPEGSREVTELATDATTGKTLFADQQTLHVVDAVRGTHRRIDIGAHVRTVEILPGKGKALVYAEDTAPFLLDISSGLRQEINGTTKSNASFYGSNEEALFFRVSGELNAEGKRPKGYMRFDLATGESKTIFYSGDHDIVQSPVRTRNGPVVRDQSKNYWRANFETGKLEPLAQKVQDDYYEGRTLVSPSGNKLFWYDASRRAYQVRDAATGTTKEIPFKSNVAENVVFSHSEKQIALMVKEENGPYLVQVLDLETGELRGAATKIPYQTNGMEFTANDQQLIVSGNYQPLLIDTKKLSALNAPRRATGPRPPLAEAAEKGALSLREDFPAIQEFFKQGKYLENPRLTSRILFQVMHESPMTFDTLLQNYPKALEKTRGKPVPLDQVPPATRQAWSESAQRYLDYKMAELAAAAQKSTIDFWKEVEVLGPLLKELPLDARKDYVNRISGSLANLAVEKDFTGVFHQKVFKFAKQRIRPIFGIEPERLVDLEPIIKAEDVDHVFPTAFSSYPIEEGKETPYGFWVKELGSIDTHGSRGAKRGEEVFDVSWKWKTIDDQEFSSHLKAKMGTRTSSFIKADPAPDYKALWKDKKLSGMVLLGENMHADADLLAEYRAYYTRAGFKFRAKEKTTDFKGWMEKAIKDGDLDYFVKEAHSDGMDREVVRFSSGGEIEIGTRALAGGKSEQVVLFHPDSRSPTVLLQNSEFGSWLQGRVSKPDAPPLLYLNTSCYSMGKACREIQAAATDKLVVFGAEDTVDTFTNDSTSYLKQLITGVRQGKSYAQMREMMAADPETASGAANTMLLPDDPKYKAFVNAQARSELEFHAETKDAAGKVIHLDGGE